MWQAVNVIFTAPYRVTRQKAATAAACMWQAVNVIFTAPYRVTRQKAATAVVYMWLAAPAQFMRRASYKRTPQPTAAAACMLQTVNRYL